MLLLTDPKHLLDVRFQTPYIGTDPCIESQGVSPGHFRLTLQSKLRNLVLAIVIIQIR